MKGGVNISSLSHGFGAAIWIRIHGHFFVLGKAIPGQITA